jgi:hypothetical protein
MYSAGAPGTLPTASIYGAPGYGRTSGLATAGWPEAQMRALAAVFLAALLEVLSAIGSAVVLFAAPVGSIVTVTNTASGSTLSVSSSGVDLLVLASVGGLLVGIVTLLLFRRGFSTLAYYDSRFETPAKLVIVEILGVILVFFGAISVFSTLLSAIQCANGAPITSTCISIGSLEGGLALLVIGGIIAFVGYIGLLIGIWRLGTIYDDSKFQVGAVLLIIPLLNVVGAILIAIAAHEHRSTLEDPSRSPTTFA